jgi:uncharacterized protein (DUF885 family)
MRRLPVTKTGYPVLPFNVLLLVVLLFVPAFQSRASVGERNPGIQKLAAEFFSWRAVQQPCSGDDIPRVERPEGWIPDCSPEGLRAQKAAYSRFMQALRALPRTGWSRTDSVDFLLLRSAIERVHWELEVLRSPFRDPDFYTEQTLGAVYELLVVSSPMTDARARDILLRLRSIPATLVHARVNLTEPVRPFAQSAVENLTGAGRSLTQLSAGLAPLVREELRVPIAAAADSAAAAIASYVQWIEAGLSAMTTRFAPGIEAYDWYLRTIALIPLSTEALLTIGRTEFARSVTAEALEQNRNAGLPEPEIARTAEAQIAQSAKDEEAIRAFLEKHDLMTIPPWLGHYRNRTTPPQIKALASMGVVDDLTSARRLNEDGVSYIPEPSGDLSFFRLASAKDPRPIVIHEGVPGHYAQLCLSWANEDPIRRHFIDPGPVEGFGFYVEEMLLQAGLFDADRPRTREIIYRFMRLRALRVEADIRLALGDFSIDQAGEFLESTVPMDRGTASGEAAFFAVNPGQAISYQIGKSQILAFLKDARLANGGKFRIREIHDLLARNANVPVALVRWEYLGLRDEIELLWPTSL